MPGLVPGIHVVERAARSRSCTAGRIFIRDAAASRADVDGRDGPSHDGEGCASSGKRRLGNYPTGAALCRHGLQKVGSKALILLNPAPDAAKPSKSPGSAGRRGCADVAPSTWIPLPRARSATRTRNLPAAVLFLFRFQQRSSSYHTF
jgi:hypothetical protein